MTPRRIHARTPLAGWFLAVLAFVAWPLAFLHDATTSHAVCPEHGEVVDVPEAHEAAEVEHDHGDGPRVGPGASGEGDHGHCPFVLLAQPKQAAGAYPHAVRPLFARVESGAVRAREARHASVPLLLLAPKQSPPV
jgi:hypothetical protein